MNSTSIAKRILIRRWTSNPDLDNGEILLLVCPKLKTKSHATFEFQVSMRASGTGGGVQIQLLAGWLWMIDVNYKLWIPPDFCNRLAMASFCLYVC